MEIKNQTPKPNITLDEFMALMEENKSQFLVNLNKSRADFFFKTRQFEKMGIMDNYEDGVEEIVKAVGEEGVTIADLHVVFPESKLLTKAYKALERAGKISVTKAGMTWLLKPIATAPAAAVIDVEVVA